jgi:hypothetical protein
MIIIVYKSMKTKNVIKNGRIPLIDTNIDHLDSRTIPFVVYYAINDVVKG